MIVEAGGISDLLDAELIRRQMSSASRGMLRHLTVLDETDSTNSVVERLPLREQHAHAVLAETQTAGRGRRQREWFSPPLSNIYLSLGWEFAASSPALPTLPLLTALCLCRALDGLGLKGHGVKWPNDVLVDGGKLAGILVDTRVGENGQHNAVIGIGVNVNMPPGSRYQQQANQKIDRRWTDLSSHLGGTTPVSRNRVAAMLLSELISGLKVNAGHGFDPLMSEWNSRDLLYGRTIEIEHRGKLVTGEACGLDLSGGLRVLPEGQNEEIIVLAGEVSVFHD